MKFNDKSLVENYRRHRNPDKYGNVIYEGMDEESIDGVPSDIVEQLDSQMHDIANQVITMVNKVGNTYKKYGQTKIEKWLLDKLAIELKDRELPHLNIKSN